MLLERHTHMGTLNYYDAKVTKLKYIAGGSLTMDSLRPLIRGMRRGVGVSMCMGHVERVSLCLHTRLL